MGSWAEGIVGPASDECPLCSDYASLDPLNIKQNNKQVRREGARAGKRLQAKDGKLWAARP